MINLIKFSFLFLFLFHAASFAQAKPKKPNVIMVVVDTLRADYLGCYGFDGDISANIDALAEESILFKRCIASSPWTKPSMASLFTSLQPQTHKVVDHLGMHWKKVGEKYKTSVLADEAVTMAEVLRNAGYQTVGLVANDFLIRRFGYGQGFERYFEPRPNRDVFSATPLLNKAHRLLKKGEIKPPFFLFFHFMDVHGPYQCRGKDFGVLWNSKSLGKNELISQKERRRIPHELGYKIPWRGDKRSRNIKNWRTCYAAGVRKFDRRLGPFLRKIRKMGLLDDSIFILTSDHGEELYDHKGWAHSHTLYKELLDIPLLIRLPKGAEGGRVVEDTVSLVDILPTLVDELGTGPLLEGWSGTSLKPLLYGEFREEEWVYGTATRHFPNMISVQNDQYKLIWNYPKGRPQLYDLTQDPLELRNVASTRPEVVKVLAKQVVRHLQALEEQGTLIESDVSLLPYEIEKLKSLGYLQ